MPIAIYFQSITLKIDCLIYRPFRLNNGDDMCDFVSATNLMREYTDLFLAY